MLKFATFQIESAVLVPKNAGTNRLARIRRQAHRHHFDYEPRRGMLYVRSRAISSRTNDNYDEFPAEEIEKGYPTFVGKPVFVNHVNDNHHRARGVIIDAALHKDRLADGSPDTWVEVLMEVDAIRFPKLAEAILKKRIDRTSMGCDVAYSICSACGNKATTPAEYCQHIPRLKGKKILKRNAATGKQEEHLIRETCYGLKFFENSLLVEPPADPTAHFLGVDDSGLKMAASKTAAGGAHDGGQPQNWQESWDQQRRDYRQRTMGWDVVEHLRDHHGIDTKDIAQHVRNLGMERPTSPEEISDQVRSVHLHQHGGDHASQAGLGQGHSHGPEDPLTTRAWSDSGPGGEALVNYLMDSNRTERAGQMPKQTSPFTPAPIRSMNNLIRRFAVEDEDDELAYPCQGGHCSMYPDEHTGHEHFERNEARGLDVWGRPKMQPYDGHGAWDCNNYECTEHPQEMYEHQPGRMPGWLIHDADPTAKAINQVFHERGLDEGRDLLAQQPGKPTKYSGLLDRWKKPSPGADAVNDPGCLNPDSGCKHNLSRHVNNGRGQIQCTQCNCAQDIPKTALRLFAATQPKVASEGQSLRDQATCPHDGGWNLHGQCKQCGYTPPTEADEECDHPKCRDAGWPEGWHTKGEHPFSDVAADEDPYSDRNLDANRHIEEALGDHPLGFLLDQNFREDGTNGPTRYSVLRQFFAEKAAEPPSVSGVVLKAADTGRILMLQRSLSDDKDPAAGTWEFPGGHHEDGDDTSLHAGIREWQEEVGQPFPSGGIVSHVWRSPNGVYQGHVVVIPSEDAVTLHQGRSVGNPDDPDGDDAEQVAWWDPAHAEKNPALRREVKKAPWDAIKKAAGQNTDRWVTCEQGHRHWGSAGAAGALVRHTDEQGTVRYLLQRRAAWVDQGGTWGIPAGAMHAGEHHVTGALREAAEELGALPADLHYLGHHIDDHGGWAFRTSVYDSPRRWTPSTDDAETDGVGWFTAAEMERLDLHPGFQASLPEVMKVAAKGLPKTQKCQYCKEPATQRLLWAEGMAYIPTCDKHQGKARHRIEVTNQDEVVSVQKVGHALCSRCGEEDDGHQHTDAACPQCGSDRLHIHLEQSAIDEIQSAAEAGRMRGEMADHAQKRTVNLSDTNDLHAHLLEAHGYDDTDLWRTSHDPDHPALDEHGFDEEDRPLRPHEIRRLHDWEHGHGIANDDPDYNGGEPGTFLGDEHFHTARRTASQMVGEDSLKDADRTPEGKCHYYPDHPHDHEHNSNDCSGCDARSSEPHIKTCPFSFHHTDWDWGYPQLGKEIHRGMTVPSIGRGGNLRDRVERVIGSLHGDSGSLGHFWTPNKEIARGFASVAHPHEGVVFHIARPKREDIETNPWRLADDEVSGFGMGNSEVPLKRGTHLDLKGVSLLKHDEHSRAHPEHPGSWERYDLTDEDNLDTRNDSLGSLWRTSMRKQSSWIGDHPDEPTLFWRAPKTKRWEVHIYNYTPDRELRENYGAEPTQDVYLLHADQKTNRMAPGYSGPNPGAWRVERKTHVPGGLQFTHNAWGAGPGHIPEHVTNQVWNAFDEVDKHAEDHAALHGQMAEHKDIEDDLRRVPRDMEAEEKAHRMFRNLIQSAEERGDEGFHHEATYLKPGRAVWAKPSGDYPKENYQTPTEENPGGVDRKDGPFYLTRHPETRAHQLVDRHNRLIGSAQGSDGSYNEYYAPDWIADSFHRLNQSGGHHDSLPYEGKEIAFQPEPQRTETHNELQDREQGVGKYAPPFEHSTDDPRVAEYQQRPEPRSARPKMSTDHPDIPAYSPEEEWHGPYEVVKHPDTGKYHVVDNQGRIAGGYSSRSAKGHDDLLDAQSSRDDIDRRAQSKEKARAMVDKMWEDTAQIFDPGSTPETRKSDKHVRSMEDLGARYADGPHHPLHPGRFDSDDDEHEGDKEGEPYYEVEDPGGSGFTARDYGGANVHIYHRARTPRFKHSDGNIYGGEEMPIDVIDAGASDSHPSLLSPVGHKPDGYGHEELHKELHNWVYGDSSKPEDERHPLGQDYSRAEPAIERWQKRKGFTW